MLEKRNMAFKNMELSASKLGSINNIEDFTWKDIDISIKYKQ